MPFDGGDNTPALNRARLIEALRNDTYWEWNFCETAGCAVGMARVMWPDVYLSEHLGLSGDQYLSIFGYIDNSENLARGLHCEWSDFYGMPRTQVTPQMVADALERAA